MGVKIDSATPSMMRRTTNVPKSANGKEQKNSEELASVSLISEVEARALWASPPIAVTREKVPTSTAIGLGRFTLSATGASKVAARCRRIERMDH